MTDSYGDIGQLLRTARQEQGLTLSAVSQAIHIRPHYLEALENGNFSDLPGVAYIKGYLQAYVAFLDLDKDEILRRFEQVEAQLLRRGFYLPQTMLSEKSPDRRFITGGILVALAALVIWQWVASPRKAEISPVEPYPQPASAMVIPSPAAPPAPLPACLQPQDVYYPPCTMVQAGAPATLPWQGQLHSVMELWNWQYTIGNI